MARRGRQPPPPEPELLHALEAATTGLEKLDAGQDKLARSTNTTSLLRALDTIFREWERSGAPLIFQSDVRMAQLYRTLCLKLFTTYGRIMFAAMARVEQRIARMADQPTAKDLAELLQVAEHAMTQVGRLQKTLAEMSIAGVLANTDDDMNEADLDAEIARLEAETAGIDAAAAEANGAA